MKTSPVGVVSAAILMVGVGVGFGTALAGGNYADAPVLSFEDQEAYEQSIVSSPSAHVLPSGIDLDYGADGNPTSVAADGTQAREALEAGSLPAGGNADSSIIEIERDKYREGGDIGP